MNRNEKIQTLKEIASGNFTPAALIHDWVWSDLGKIYKCITLPDYDIAPDKFEAFINKLPGTRHFLFAKDVKPYLPASPVWFSDDFRIFVAGRPTWQDDTPHLELMVSQREFEPERIAIVQTTPVEVIQPPIKKEPIVEELELEPVEPSQFVKEYTFRLSDYSRNYFNKRF
jgi:hypothetical protein